MAAKKPASPRKFKQARKDAKSAAKQAFSGKSQARLKDPLTKLTADDKLALNEMKAQAKAELGNKAYLSTSEYKAQQEAAREKFREQMREEGLYKPKAGERTSGTAKVTDRRTPAEKALSKKAAAKEVAKNTKKGAAKVTDTPVSKKPSVKKPAVTEPKLSARKMRSIENKKAWAANREADMASRAKQAKMSRAMDKAIKENPNFGPSKAKTTAVKSKGVATTTPRFVESTRVNAPAGTKEVAVRSKGTVATGGGAKPPAATSAASKAARFGKLKKLGKFSILGAAAAEGVSAVKGSSEKDFREIQRLENKLASLQGKAPKYKNMGSNKNVGESVKADLSSLAALASMGAVGKTRRERMDELNAKIAKAQKVKNKAIAAGRAAKPGISPAGARSSSKINKTFAQASPATPGGNTASISQGTTYRVKSGDTLSKIAKTAGVNVNDLLATNKKFTTNAKYKGGSMIWSGTTVKIPKKK